WGYYNGPGTVSNCVDANLYCKEQQHGFLGTNVTPNIWNPLPNFTTVHQDHEVGNVQTTPLFIKAAREGKLPNVSWIVPDGKHSEHPPELISVGQAFVTRIVNAVMRYPDWKSTAIFITWYDWRVIFDHLCSSHVT